MELVGEYTGPDGQPQELRAPCDAPVAADPYQSLLAGMARMRDLVNELVEASQDLMASPDSDEDSDGDDEDDAEDESNIDNGVNSEEPSAKRFKNST